MLYAAGSRLQMMFVAERESFEIEQQTRSLRTISVSMLTGANQSVS